MSRAGHSVASTCLKREVDLLLRVALPGQGLPSPALPRRFSRN